MSEELRFVRDLTDAQCLDLSGGYYPPRIADYDNRADFLADASEFWGAFGKAMRENGMRDTSLLLAGCLALDWEDAGREQSHAQTMAAREKRT